MTLPNFLIVGAQKAGTSWLAAALRQHPDIFVADEEVHFFDKEHNWAKGVKWYEQHFDDADDETAVGEKTPDYFWTGYEGTEGHLPDVHENVYEVLPDAKLLVVLRDPVERAISAVNHLVRTGRLSPFVDIDEALVGDKRHLVRPHGVVSYGFYDEHLEAYLDLFEEDQIHVEIFEELVLGDSEARLAEVFSFLGVDSNVEIQDLDDPVNEHRGSMPRLIAENHAPTLAPITRFADLFLPEWRYEPPSAVEEELVRNYEESSLRLRSLVRNLVNANGRIPVPGARKG